MNSNIKMLCKAILSLVLVLTLNCLIIGADNVVNAKDQEDEQLMYRLYNTYSSEHLYTSDENEMITLSANPTGWVYEGYGFVASNDGDPVYRLYNPYSGEHHYTIDENEKETLLAGGLWEYEKIGWYSKDTDDACAKKMYRLYNPKALGSYEPGAHHYTLDDNEKETLVNEYDWVYEGTSFISLHDITDNDDEVEATCITEGYSGGAKCKTCNKAFDGNVTPINPNNHKHTSYHDGETKTWAEACRCNICNQIIWKSDEEGSICTIDEMIHFHQNPIHGCNYDVDYLTTHMDEYSKWRLTKTDLTNYTEVISQGYIHCEDCGKDI